MQKFLRQLGQRPQELLSLSASAYAKFIRFDVSVRKNTLSRTAYGRTSHCGEDCARKHSYYACVELRKGSLANGVFVRKIITRYRSWRPQKFICQQGRRMQETPVLAASVYAKFIR